MISLVKATCLAGVLACAISTGTMANEGTASPLEFMNARQESSEAKPAVRSELETKANPTTARRPSMATARSGPAGTAVKQISSVSTACLKPQLMRIIRNASEHFGSAAVITSGYRRSRSSYHGKCMAADVQIAGVSPGTLARYFRAQPGVGGVGTYGHTRSVHVDVAPRVYTWYHGRRGRSASLKAPQV